MNHDFFTGYNAELKGRSRQLRKDMTRQERHIWYDFLRDYPVKVYRQRSIDWFIADFYCSRAHLVIEIDGGQHYTPEGRAYDTERSAVLQNYNLTVVRVSDADVDQTFPVFVRSLTAGSRRSFQNGKTDFREICCLAS